jgi:hypothetical protein
LFPGGKRFDQKNLTGCVDSASAQIAQLAQNFFARNGLCKLTDPPHSHGISPSDFSLFGKVRSSLISKFSRDKQKLFDDAIDILHREGIQKLFIRLGFSFPGRVQTAPVNGYAKLMDYVKICDFPEKKPLPKGRRKSWKTEKCHFDETPAT